MLPPSPPPSPPPNLSPDEAIRLELQTALTSATSIQQAFLDLGDGFRLLSFFEKGFFREALAQIHKILHTSLNPVATIVGYLDGLEARTLLRDQMRASCPAVDHRASPLEQIEACKTTAALVASGLAALLQRPSFAILPGVPSQPGPLRVAQAAREHLFGAEDTFAHLLAYALQDKPHPQALAFLDSARRYKDAILQRKKAHSSR